MGLARTLPPLGVEVVLFRRRREPLCQAHIEGLDCRVLGLSDRGGLWWEQVSVPRAIARERIDVFHAPAEHGVPFLTRRPVVLTIHSVTRASYERLITQGLLPGPVSRYLPGVAAGGRASLGDWYWHRQVRRADHIITPSDFARQEVLEFLQVPSDRVSAIPLAADQQFDRPERPTVERREALARLGVREPYLLYVGGYEPHKNVSGLLTMFAEFHRARPEVQLALVGTKGVPEELLDLARESGLVPGETVCFCCNLGPELTDLYDSAAVFVSMSWRETFCLPALEAMTRGTPVVVSAWGATPEVVGASGVLIDPRDPAAACEAVLRLLDNSNRDTAAARARQAAARFSWSTTAARTLEVYTALKPDSPPAT